MHLETELMAPCANAREEGKNASPATCTIRRWPRPPAARHHGTRSGPAHRVKWPSSTPPVNWSPPIPSIPTPAKPPAAVAVAALWRSTNVELVAIGATVPPRVETGAFLPRRAEARSPVTAQKVIVSEAGASVYSASGAGGAGVSGLDVMPRGAKSHRPPSAGSSAELEIDLKSIGVGRGISTTSARPSWRVSWTWWREDCGVNAVGADPNTASVPLLTRVAGLTRMMAQEHRRPRDENGRSRTAVSQAKVSRLGPKAFEQCARLPAYQPRRQPAGCLHRSPGSLPGGRTYSGRHQQALKDLMGTGARHLKAVDFTDEKFASRTVTGTLSAAGGRPRSASEFKTAKFADGVETMNDLLPGMILEGAVTNVTNFGAFVDIGVHQDGLVHISVAF